MNDQDDDIVKEEGIHLRPKRSLLSRLFWGGLLGFGVMILLFFLVSFGIFLYMRKPGNYVNEFALLSPKSTVFLRANLDFEDEGIRALVKNIIELLKKKDFNQIPENFRNLLRNMEQTPGQTIELLQEFVAVRMILIGEPVMNHELEWFAVLSIKKYPRFWTAWFNLIKIQVKQEEESEVHHGITIVKIKNTEKEAEPRGMAMVQNNLFIGSNLKMTRAGIERIQRALKGPVHFPGSPLMKKTIQAMNANGDLLVGITNDGSSIKTVLSKITGPKNPLKDLEGIETISNLPADDLVNVALDFNLLTAQKATIHFHLQGKESSNISFLQEKLSHILSSILENDTVAQTSLLFHHKMTIKQKGVIVLITMNRILDWIKDLLPNKVAKSDFHSNALI